MSARRGIKVAFAAVALAAAAASPALATTVSVGGGTWSYDTGASTAWSNYKHPSVNHSSSVHGTYWSYSGCTKPGVWALASTEDSGTSSAYWDKGCSL
ncbi:MULTISPECIES: lactococcin 972 family bacteriocin [Streptomyces]|uniref:Lactococcin 972 family bacteriocin n=2 Tax=Streptomyces TaxID=1883 RepID=A0ABV9J7R4_9ACTN